MQWNLTTILLMAGIFLLGYGIGLGEMYLRQRRKIRRLEESLQRKETASPADVLPSQPVSALRLWFDEAQNAKLELDGASLVSPQQITPAQRRRLIALLNMLRPWLEHQTIRESPAPVSPAPTPKTAAIATEADRTAQAVSLTMSSPTSLEQTAAALNIVEQINQILQRLLAGTPLAGKVRLREKAGGGIEIWVGAKQYTAIEDVAEVEVKTAIRAAIAEWERRA